MDKIKKTRSKRSTVDDFLAQKKIALYGCSRSGRKFGNYAYKQLKNKGYIVYPIHPKAKSIQNEPCWPSLSKLPEEVGGVLIIVPPSETEKIVREAHESKVKRVWMQQGSESSESIEYCNNNVIAVIHNECIMMFAKPTALPHKVHRGLWGLLGKLPE